MQYHASSTSRLSLTLTIVAPPDFRQNLPPLRHRKLLLLTGPLTQQRQTPHNLPKHNPNLRPLLKAPEFTPLPAPFTIPLLPPTYRNLFLHRLVRSRRPRSLHDPQTPQRPGFIHHVYVRY
jgi:hypothetical protein